MLFLSLDISFRRSLFFLINWYFAAIEKTLTNKLEDARNSLQLRIVKALREYRNLYSVQHRLGARMIYPESLKFLFLYGLALSKSVPLKGGYADAQLDERCAAGFTMMALPVKKLLKLLYPSLIRVDEHLLKVKDFDPSNIFQWRLHFANWTSVLSHICSHLLKLMISKTLWRDCLWLQKA